ncbi:glycerate kinase, partial [Nocardia brasiliensis]|uniref:glycerate kinase n=1 Tax=Nocardia brasiliensis TaxID=37326 RepID=UPI002458F20E
MRVLVAPDKFKGSLSAAEVARCLVLGLSASGAECRALPLAEGRGRPVGGPPGPPGMEGPGAHPRAPRVGSPPRALGGGRGGPPPPRPPPRRAEGPGIRPRMR